MQAKLQTEIDAIEIEAAAGGGMVAARMNGKKELVALKIQPDAITPDDPELLQDLILAAVNEAGRKVEERIQEVTQGMAGGMGMPGFPGLT
jgi:DNA-binding YbaB/EbfC family protein